MTETTNATQFHDSTLDGNERIEDAIRKYSIEKTDEALVYILHAIHVRMNEGGHMIIPVITSDDGTEFTFRSIQLDDGSVWMVLFTSQKEFSLGEKSEALSYFIDETLRSCLANDGNGFIINPFGEAPFMLTKDLIQLFFEADAQVREGSNA